MVTVRAHTLLTLQRRPRNCKRRRRRRGDPRSRDQVGSCRTDAVKNGSNAVENTTGRIVNDAIGGALKTGIKG